MREFAPTQQLTSNCWTWGPWMATQVEAVRNGTFEGKWCELDINDGAISLAEVSDAVPQDVRDAVADAEQRLRDGYRLRMCIWKHWKTAESQTAQKSS